MVQHYLPSPTVERNATLLHTEATAELVKARRTLKSAGTTFIKGFSAMLAAVDADRCQPRVHVGGAGIASSTRTATTFCTRTLTSHEPLRRLPAKGRTMRELSVERNSSLGKGLSLATTIPDFQEI